tara:strand:- start:62 stop:436 length:375 start_codon:yes stop_codon:yes gene_type:complete
MAEQIIDIRERIEKMRIKFDVDQNEKLILEEKVDKAYNENKNLEENVSQNEVNLLKHKNVEIQNIKTSKEKTNNINNKEEIENSFPSVSLSVKNPVSSKILVILMTLQIFSNIGILFLLYSLMD